MAEMGQLSNALALLAEDQSLGLSTHAKWLTTTYNSSSKGPHALSMYVWVHTSKN